MKYKPEYVDLVESMMSRGATYKTLAEAFGVCEDTIGRWKNQHPEFGAALETGSLNANQEVAASLYRMAIGYTYQEERSIWVAVADGQKRLESVTLTKYVPPQPQAAIFWLRNRMPELWSEKRALSSQNADELLSEILTP